MVAQRLEIVEAKLHNCFKTKDKFGRNIKTVSHYLKRLLQKNTTFFYQFQTVRGNEL